MLNLKFTYRDCIEQSERVQWRLDDVMKESDSLDFGKPFLPETLMSHVLELDWLSEDCQLTVNQVAANAYLNLFQFVEEYILATMMDHAQAELFGDATAMRALTRMVDEELKHQMLFRRFRAAFDRGVGHPCGVLENASEVAEVIMGHSPLAVLLITLHIEWLTQSHYTESARGDERIDPLFRRLLHSHWLEESQHARIDMLEIDKLAQKMDQVERENAIDEYLDIVEAFDGLLGQQVYLDLRSIGALQGAEPKEPAALRTALHQSYRRTFLWYGMVNRNVQRVLGALSPSGAQMVMESSAKFA